MTVTTRPLKRPAAAPTARAASTPRAAFAVASQTQTKPTMPSAMTDGNERSMSPATMTMVRAMAVMAK